MGATVTAEYECGFRVDQASVLRDDQTLLANAALADQLIAQADAAHDAGCEVCRREREAM